MINFILADATKAVANAAQATKAAVQGTTNGAGQPNGLGSSPWIWIVYFVVIIAAMYFIFFRPQKKKQKEEEAMKNNTQVGDEILSIGGIYGKIIAVKEDSYIVESGPDRSKVRIAKWGIQQNFTVHETQKQTATAEKKSIFGRKKKKDTDEDIKLNGEKLDK